MEIPRLRLESPPQHDIYSNLMGDSYSRPISASTVLTSHAEVAPADLSRLRICLVRVLSSRVRQRSSSGENLLGRFNHWLSSTSKPSVSCNTRLCSIIEEMTLHMPLLGRDSQVGYSPEEGRIYKIPFYMPIPANIPPTSATNMGRISYFLVVSISTVDGRTSSTSQEINLSRQIIPERSLVRHTRIYPNSNLFTKIVLTQNIALTTKSTVSLNANVFVRPSTPAGRSTEYTRVAVRGIRWRVEEVTKLLNQTECEDRNLAEYQEIKEQASTREIVHGFLQGYWQIVESPITTKHPPQNKDASVEIPLEISFPRRVTPAPEVHLGCYDSLSKPADSLPPSIQKIFSSTTQQKIMLTVEHRLKLDILTTEDTFSVSKHRLVDRKPLQIARNASFPLQIINKAEADFEEVIGQDNPPRYEEFPEPPPDYEHRL
ncbi:uncharacterized protein N7459_001453 [Penicillium hispanicum]|uniref:uncharacterized protein n=1 Tax=Penicillium hispanicum TaxID=1080232 RepID=UPI002542446C|nr:uncharacterized protein N7459_001453 [Penicillium hispanicum]KAJ5595245.1 hypothetical protein N7459_001453 [Penicillium hispanicum]